MRKLKTALIALILIPPSMFFGPQLYYYLCLPSTANLSSVESTKSAFSHWAIQNESILNKREDFPPKEFKCATCYPYSIESFDCKLRMSSWISRSILFTEPHEKMLVHHAKNYFLAQALLSKYEDVDLYRLYLAFIARPIGAYSINQACLEKFKKRCPDLSFDETIELEIAGRFGKSNRSHNEIKEKIKLFCAK